MTSGADLRVIDRQTFMISISRFGFLQRLEACLYLLLGKTVTFSDRKKIFEGESTH